MIDIMKEYALAAYLLAVLSREACPIRSGWVENYIVTGKKLIIWYQNKNCGLIKEASLIKKDQIE
jgi:hypothetical protein